MSKKNPFRKKNKVHPKYKITINEIEYESIKDFCAKTGTKENTIYVQLKRYGLPITASNIEDLINKKLKRNYERNKLFETLNITNNYRINQIAEYLRNKNLPITKENIQNWVDKKLQFNPDYNNFHRRIIVDGIKYYSIRDFCRKNHVPLNTLFNWLRCHNLKSSAKNIETFFKDYISKKFVFNNKVYINFTDFCKEYNINANTIKNYLHYHKLVCNEENVKNYFDKRGIKYENL